MQLSDYLKPLGREQRLALAQACSTTVGQLANVAFSGRLCGVRLAVLLEQHTAGAVTRRDLRPDDWHLLWPELIRAIDAQAVSARVSGVAGALRHGDASLGTSDAGGIPLTGAFRPIDRPIERADSNLTPGVVA